MTLGGVLRLLFRISLGVLSNVNVLGNRWRGPGLVMGMQDENGQRIAEALSKRMALRGWCYATVHLLKR